MLSAPNGCGPRRLYIGRVSTAFSNMTTISLWRKELAQVYGAFQRRLGARRGQSTGGLPKVTGGAAEGRHRATDLRRR
jgi:hypothetical protein